MTRGENLFVLSKSILILSAGRSYTFRSFVRSEAEQSARESLGPLLAPNRVEFRTARLCNSFSSQPNRVWRRSQCSQCHEVESRHKYHQEIALPTVAYLIDHAFCVNSCLPPNQPPGQDDVQFQGGNVSWGLGHANCEYY